MQTDCCAVTGAGHLLKQLRHDLLEALHHHGAGRLRTLAAVDILLGYKLRSVRYYGLQTPTPPSDQGVF
jgi:hypothetical protein